MRMLGVISQAVVPTGALWQPLRFVIAQAPNYVRVWRKALDAEAVGFDLHSSQTPFAYLSNANLQAKRAAADQVEGRMSCGVVGEQPVFRVQSTSDEPCIRGVDPLCRKSDTIPRVDRGTG